MTVADGGALAAEFALLMIVLGLGLVGSLAGLIGQFRLERSWDHIDAACDVEDGIQFRLNRAARMEAERNVKRLAEQQERERQILALEVDVMVISTYLAFIMPDYSWRPDPLLLPDEDDTPHVFLNSGDVFTMAEVIR